MPEAAALEIVQHFAQYGGVAAVISLAWWRAEQRAEKAQTVADTRAAQLLELVHSQANTNNAVSTALALLSAEVQRLKP